MAAVLASSGATRTARMMRGVLIPLAVVVIWQIVTGLGWINPIILPSPLAVVAKWWQYLKPTVTMADGVGAWLNSSELLMDAANSLYRVVMGFLVGAVIALPLGLLMGTSSRIYGLFNPLVQVVRPIPPIAYIPLAILWFGLGNPPAFFLIALGAFFPVLMNTIAGVRHVDGIYLRAARNLGASQFTIFRRVIMPAATPYILSGIRIGIGTAFIVVIVAEMIAVNNGLGYRILEAREYMWSDKIIAGMLTIGLLGLVIDLGMDRLNNHLLKWHRGLETK
ncbi:ABC transporter permease [Pandoraea sp. XJJ-1]|uniref:Sulfonate ABC transporter permease n=3 Tax=Pandoraea TaxID=93217 RepID=A0A5E4RXW2_9BURK|nr:MULTISPECIES: ABC transporter permease [Pandoraea]WAL83312.1 ABC transporter permease [Pandoraea sp. XJJ-1]BDD91486.1 sulfonate ABC transporter permease [Pandoraea sp. NE5]VVD67763.1 sulfonate ABC transporter permease [Pandoraea cepalis]VVD86042.1 sulfonate ABC transporter permease [Pandoraea soli]